MPASAFGISGGWSGTRATKNLPELFPGYPDFTTNTDMIAQFYTIGKNR
jgi:hypothetical protein